MRSEIRLWSVVGSKLVELKRTSFAESYKEKDLEEWVEQDPSLLGRNLAIIGRQIYLPKVGTLDLLAVDEEGRIVIIEFKREQSTRDTIAQILDYVSSIRLMELDQIKGLANVNAAEAEEITDVEPQMIIVAAECDDSVERIVEYLASHVQLPIEVVTFTYATLEDGREIIARSILVPEQSVKISDKPNPKITREEIFAIAKQRGVLHLVESLHRVEKLGWSVELMGVNGGSIRYWVKLKDGTWRVLFGLYIGGEKYASPQAELDVWIRVQAVAESSGEMVETIRTQLIPFHLLNETETATVLRIKDLAVAVRLFDLLEGWQPQPA